MKVFEPISTAASSPAPPSNGSPSMVPAIGDDDAVAALGFAAFRPRGEWLVLLGDARQPLLDLGVGDVAGQLLELDLLEIGERDRRHDFDRHGVIEVALAGDQLLDRALLLGIFTLGSEASL